MSDVGTMMDALVTAVETVSGFTAQRGLKLSADLNDEDFPYACVFDPDETAEPLPFLMERVTYDVPIWFYTRGETQEATLLKLDAIRDAIVADRTLGSTVQFCNVIGRQLREDPGDNMKAGSLIVRAVEETGRIFSVTVDLEVWIKNPVPAYDSFETAIKAFIATYLTNAGTMASDYLTDRDEIPVDTMRYQVQWFPLAWDYTDSNVKSTAAAIRIIVYYHMGPSTVESTSITNVIMEKVDGLLLTAQWRALTVVSDVKTPPSITLDGDVTRQEE